MEKDELRKKIYSKIDELPTLPAALPRLLSLIEDSRTSSSQIAEVISRDPALTSKILKVANSAYYGFQQQIAGLDRAVPLLGFNMVRSLALSLSVIHSLPSDAKSSHFSREGLWLHSLTVALMIQELAKRLNKGDGSVYLFIIGLLHDIGKIVFDQFFTDLFQQALEDCVNTGQRGIHLAERRVIGIDHGEVGAMLLTRWKLPDVISAPIAAHHLTDIPDGTSAVDVAMLRIADALSNELDSGEQEESVPPETYAADLDILEVNEEELEDIRAHLQGVQEGIHAFYNAMS